MENNNTDIAARRDEALAKQARAISLATSDEDVRAAEADFAAEMRDILRERPRRSLNHPRICPIHKTN